MKLGHLVHREQVRRSILVFVIGHTADGGKIVIQTAGKNLTEIHLECDCGAVLTVERRFL